MKHLGFASVVGVLGLASVGCGFLGESIQPGYYLSANLEQEVHPAIAIREIEGSTNAYLWKQIKCDGLEQVEYTRGGAVDAKNVDFIPGLSIWINEDLCLSSEIHTGSGDEIEVVVNGEVADRLKPVSREKFISALRHLAKFRPARFSESRMNLTDNGRELENAACMESVGLTCDDLFGKVEPSSDLFVEDEDTTANPRSGSNNRNNSQSGPSSSFERKVSRLIKGDLKTLPVGTYEMVKLDMRLAARIGDELLWVSHDRSYTVADPDGVGRTFSSEMKDGARISMSLPSISKMVISEKGASEIVLSRFYLYANQRGKDFELVEGRILKERIRSFSEIPEIERAVNRGELRSLQFELTDDGLYKMTHLTRGGEILVTLEVTFTRKDRD